jgi:drug/metabolite transporter (DMT)-like permease
MRPTAQTFPSSAFHLNATDLGLYATTVAVWGASWIALKSQIGVVAPEVSTLWRFLIAVAVMVLWVAWRREPMRFSSRDHALFAATGACMFSLNFVCFLYGGAHLPSGLMAVVFSLASVLNLLLGAAVLREPIEPRVAAGGFLGATGVGLLYWPEIAGAGYGAKALAGLGFCIAGTLFFCLGNLASTVIQRRDVPILAANAWGMAYGVAVLTAVSLVRGRAFTVEWTPVYLGSLIYLALFASVVAFACYLTLLRRIGAARAGYATVLFPVIALAISTLVEGYRWTPMAMLGAALAMAGNVLVLRRR